MSTPGAKRTIHLAKTTPGEIAPNEGFDAGDVNDDQSITEPLPLPEGSPHQSGQRPLSLLAQSDDRAEPRPDAAPGPPVRLPKTSLLEWLNLIEIGCRDATVTVQADDGRDGRLWCVRGEIVDAEWGPLKGPAAADRILSFREGDISVEFGAVDRPRVISSTTGVLLLQTAQRIAESGGKSASLFSESRDVSARHESQPPPAPASGMGSGIHSEMPVARSHRPSAPVERPAGRHSPYMAGALAGAAIAFTVWQLSAPAAKPKPAAAAAPIAHALPPVTIEPIADSRLREIPVNVGDGLPVVADEPVTAGGGERVTKPSGDRQRHARTEVTRRRAPAAALARPNADEARRNEAAARAKAQQVSMEAVKAKIEISDASKPKIQIIDPQKPRVQIIEPGKPKVQIIEPLKSKVDLVDIPQVKLIE